MGRKSLASVYQEERLSRGPGPPVSDESPVCWWLVGVASARSQPRGSLSAAASRPGSEVGALVPPTGSLVAAVNEVLVSGGHGPHPELPQSPGPCSAYPKSIPPVPRTPFPGKPSLVVEWVPTGQAWAMVSTVCTQHGGSGHTWPTAMTCIFPAPRAPKAACPGVENATPGPHPASPSHLRAPLIPNAYVNEPTGPALPPAWGLDEWL